VQSDTDGNIVFTHTQEYLFIRGYILRVLAYFGLFFIGLGIYFLLVDDPTGHSGSDSCFIGSCFLLISLAIYIFFKPKSLKYTFKSDGIGLEVSVTRGSNIFIPYTAITGFRSEYSDEIIIHYTKGSGVNRDTTISPDDREAFISELTKRTGTSVTQMDIDADGNLIFSSGMDYLAKFSRRFLFVMGCLFIGLGIYVTLTEPDAFDVKFFFVFSGSACFIGWIFIFRKLRTFKYIFKKDGIDIVRGSHTFILYADISYFRLDASTGSLNIFFNKDKNKNGKIALLPGSMGLFINELEKRTDLRHDGFDGIWKK